MGEYESSTVWDTVVSFDPTGGAKLAALEFLVGMAGAYLMMTPETQHEVKIWGNINTDHKEFRVVQHSLVVKVRDDTGRGNGELIFWLRVYEDRVAFHCGEEWKEKTAALQFREWPFSLPVGKFFDDARFTITSMRHSLAKALEKHPTTCKALQQAACGELRT
jgi:hypothetical protein